jgi:hypothetical protein
MPEIEKGKDKYYHIKAQEITISAVTALNAIANEEV